LEQAFAHSLLHKLNCLNSAESACNLVNLFRAYRELVSERNLGEFEFESAFAVLRPAMQQFGLSTNLEAITLSIPDEEREDVERSKKMLSEKCTVLDSRVLDVSGSHHSHEYAMFGLLDSDDLLDNMDPESRAILVTMCDSLSE